MTMRWNNGMRYLAALLVASAVTGCASFLEEHSHTMLIDYNTGETRTCEVGKLRTAVSYERYRDCIEDFKAQGYTVWSSY
jgi:hypothetical protein